MDFYGEAFWALGHDPAMFGHVIGDVFLDSCISTNVRELVDRLSPMEQRMGDFSPNRWMLRVLNPNFYAHPTPAKGSQRFWYWEDKDADYTVR